MHYPPGHQEVIDNDHLNLLKIFHYIYGALCALGLGFLLVHFLMFQMFLMNDDFMSGKNGDPMPDQIKPLFYMMYVVMGGVILFFVVGNILAARFIGQRKGRTFCFIMAGLNCMQIPFGTLIGVFTFIVLGRYTVKMQFDANQDVKPPSLST